MTKRIETFPDTNGQAKGQIQTQMRNELGAQHPSVCFVVTRGHTKGASSLLKGAAKDVMECALAPHTPRPFTKFRREHHFRRKVGIYITDIS